jgi:hypothetical protein
LMGAETLTRICAMPPEKQARAFEREVKRVAPHLLGELEARYVTLSGSTIKRRLALELRDEMSSDDEEVVNPIDRQIAADWENARWN